MLVSYQCCVEQDRTGETVKIHYVGCSSQYEWRSVFELVDKAVEVNKHEQDASFLRQELAYRIKSNLSCSRKSSPEVRIELPFDKKVFDQNDLLVIAVTQYWTQFISTLTYKDLSIWWNTPTPRSGTIAYNYGSC